LFFVTGSNRQLGVALLVAGAADMLPARVDVRRGEADAGKSSRSSSETGAPAASSRHP
jgi:hypothetical protein